MGLLDKITKKKKDEPKSVKKIADVKIEKEKAVFEPKLNAKVAAKSNVEELKEVKVEPKKEISKKVVTGGLNNLAHKVLVRPLVSEKSALSEVNGRYTFVINKTANKLEVKQSVKEVYGITPKKVRIINVEGKRPRFGRKKGKRTDWKKAIVTLPKGKTISIHEGV